MVHSSQVEIKETILKSRYSLINKTKKILDHVLYHVSREENLIIICNVINEMSLDLLYNGAEPKSHLISYRTEKEGVLGGYIIKKDDINHHSKIIKFIDSKGAFLFYNENNSIVTTEKYNVYTPYLEAITNNQGDFLTSDLDILAIGSKAKVDNTAVEKSYGMGSILKYEVHFANLINYLFSHYIKKENTTLEKDFIPIIRHGPFNRYINSNLEDIYFPVVIYHPSKGKFLIGSENYREDAIQELLKLMYSFNNEGYNIDVHSNWKK